jgi:hypothetical protein
MPIEDVNQMHNIALNLQIFVKDAIVQDYLKLSIHGTEEASHLGRKGRNKDNHIIGKIVHT